MILPMMAEMKGYMKVFVVDCKSPAIDINKFPTCKKENNPNMLPMFNLVVPPEVKVNPYTGQPMKPRMVAFPQNTQINKHILKKWASGHLPDYTIKIES